MVTCKVKNVKYFIFLFHSGDLCYILNEILHYKGRKKLEINKYVGAQIKKWRELRNYTQDDLAEMMGVAKQTISRYEKGDRGANQDVLFQLAQILKVSINEFFPPVESKQSNPKIETIAAHIDEDVTDEEMIEIQNYIEYIKSKRK